MRNRTVGRPPSASHPGPVASAAKLREHWVLVLVEGC
jgi:hypothetical protein